MKNTKQHLYWLDWMRFIAAFMVMICHARGYNWIEWGKLNIANHTFPIEVFYAVTRPGNEWVVVFFVLSGFLVGGAVINRCIQGTFELPRFMIDRITRIWIPLIPALLLSWVVAIICKRPVSLGEFLGNLFALQGVLFNNFAGNEPLWSLSYEVWFYVISAAVGMFIISKNNLSLKLSVVLLMVCFAIFTKLMPVFLFVWLIGSLCYYLIDEARRTGLVFASTFLVLLGVACSQLRIETRSIHAERIMNYLPSWEVALLIEGLGIGMLFATICKKAPQGVALIFFEKIGTILSKFSYTLYLTHYPILHLWEYYFPERAISISKNSLFLFFSKVFSCLFFGWLFYLPFESKTSFARKWLRNFLNISGYQKIHET